jgi:hypothetical protein
VLVVLEGDEETLGDHSESVCEELPFVTLLGCTGVNNVVEVGVCNMDFVRVDPDDGAVFGVELGKLESVLAGLDTVEVEFVATSRVISMTEAWSLDSENVRQKEE